MPKVVPAKNQESFQSLPLQEQIRVATPLARRLITEGIDYGQRIDGTTTADRIQELLRDQELARLLRDGSDEERDRLEDWLEAARAVGIALGLMLNPALFVKGGAR
jgi:hypothetical protein